MLLKLYDAIAAHAVDSVVNIENENYEDNNYKAQVLIVSNLPPSLIYKYDVLWIQLIENFWFKICDNWKTAELLIQ